MRDVKERADPALARTFPHAPLDASTTCDDTEDARLKRVVGARLFPNERPPERIGRYRLLEQIGSGGMGVVYAAHDESLDRTVAIKVLRALGRDAGDAVGVLRLEREAQAMARLAHPNVIVVHEVGRYEERVFVAMEYIDGVTLDRWWADAGAPARRRSWRAVIKMFLQAGEGLAAAHAAGVVHRDFKPGNVLVGRDGRARVLDFGLARLDDAEESLTTTLAMSTPRDAVAALDGAGALTRTGAVLGTPAYMAPEQFEGAATGPASDQFSYCASLYEALYGTRPFRGETALQVYEAIRARRLAAPAVAGSGDAPPAGVRSILCGARARARGALAVDARAARRARERGPAAARGWYVAGAAALLGGGLVLGALVLQPGERPAAQARLDGRWDDARRAALRTSLRASGRSYADAVLRVVEAGLDEYAARWVEMARESCEATRVHAVQSAELMDLRGACLQRRLDELSATTRLLLEPGPAAPADALDHAVRLVEGLSPLTPCADVESLRAAVPWPEGQEERARLERVSAELASVKALRIAGRSEDGLKLARALIEELTRLEFDPLLAEARLYESRLRADRGERDEAARALEQATAAAARSRQDALLVECWLAALWQRADQGASAEVLEVILDAARVALARAGSPPYEAALLHSVAAYAHHRSADYERALARYDDAFALIERHALGAGFGLTVRLNRANLLAVTRTDEAAEAEIAATHAALSEHFGPEHPRAVSGLVTLADFYSHAGRERDSVALLREALAIRERTLGRDDPKTLQTLGKLATRLPEIGEFRQGVALQRRALVQTRARFGERHVEVAMALGNLGTNLMTLRLYGEAESVVREALAIELALFGAEHVNVAIDRLFLAEALHHRGADEDALPEIEAALASFDASVGQGHEYTATALALRGTIRGALGQRAAGRADLEAGLAGSGRARRGASDVVLIESSRVAGSPPSEGEGEGEGREVAARTALARLEALHGPRTPSPSARACSSRRRWAKRRRAPAAIELLERGLAQAEAAGAPETLQGALQVTLARVLARTPAGRGRERGRVESLERVGLARLDPADPLRAAPVATR
ncbi:MAG: serine/threonine protein kinase [Myxococcales bacterium]|nr:serine/threonine protein kinase [Myxococcales bacterium]